jgi:N-acetylglucosaminyl-diphospho-decaprenol L-rhamnosyltransferase
MTLSPPENRNLALPIGTFLFTIDWRNRGETNGLIACLANLPARLLVVVNDSLPASYSVPANAAIGVDILQAGRNIGFAAACNLALRIAKKRGATQVVHLNNDLRVSNLETFSRYIADSQRSCIALSSPTVLTTSGKVEFAGSSLWSRLCPAIVSTKPLQRDASGFRDSVFVTGACFTLKVAAAEGIGGFDERYFAYREEHDLAVRLSHRGGRVAHYASACVVHRTSASANRTPYFKRFLLTRGQILFGIKNMRGLAAVAYWAVFFTKQILFLLQTGVTERRAFAEQYRAIRDAFLNALGGRIIVVHVLGEAIEF